MHKEIRNDNPYTHIPNENTFSCNTCNLKFPTVNAVKAHIKSHEKVYICEICEEIITDAYKLVDHTYDHNKDFYRCPFCSLQSPLRHYLYCHLTRVHLQQFKCKHCGNFFKSSQSLKEHEEMHANDMLHTCIVCEKTYIFPKSLQQHQIKFHTVHIEDDSIQNQCHICLKIYKCPRTLKKHLKTHEKRDETNRKRHLCDICGKSYASNRQLVAHHRVHSGIKPFSCKTCEKSFTKREYLVLHERIHTGEKPYICQYCGKRFNQPAPLKLHIRGHTGEKPYVCHICDIGFPSKFGLQTHLKNCLG